ncbi:MAG: ribosome biogenesis GTP-binding protein YihA/YsxC [Chromatiaceae bacterium]|nr:ribosome biogenesis GTP-binding protein YihA/YsxC [Chromatiaceae bacterium]
MDPFYQRACFAATAARMDLAPPDTGWEVAFAGRSNAGKSSAINAICHQKQLARTSKTPGRTQQLVFFALDEARRLVDLPGYGYAKVSASVKHQWQRLMADYLEQRQSLAGVVLVMDIRHPLTAFDLQMLEWARRINLELLLLLTKSDKLKSGPARMELDRVRKALSEDGTRVQVELFSAQTRMGIEPVHRLLDRWLGIQA